MNGALQPGDRVRIWHFSRNRFDCGTVVRSTFNGLGYFVAVDGDRNDTTHDGTYAYRADERIEPMSVVDRLAELA